MIVPVLLVTVTVLIVVGSFLYGVLSVFEPSLLGSDETSGRTGRRKWANRTREQRRHHQRRLPRSQQRDFARRTSSKRDSSKRDSVVRTEIFGDEDVPEMSRLRRRSARQAEKEAEVDRFGFAKEREAKSNSVTDSDSDSDSDLDSGANSVDSQTGREALNAKQLIEDFSARFRTAFGARRGASREQSGARDEMAFVHGVSGALRGAGALLLAPVAATGAMAADGALNLRARRMPRQRSLQRSFSSREEDLARDESRHFVPQVGERFAEGAIQHHPCLVTTMKAHEDLTTAVAFSPSGQYVATAGGEHESEIRLSLRATLVEDEALARSHIIRLPVDDWVGALVFSKDSFFLVVGTGVLGQILVYHVYRRFSTKPTLEASFASDHVGPIRHLYMSTVPGTDTHYIASAASEGDTALKFWSFGTSKPKLLHKFELGARFALVEKVRFSSTGKLLAVVGREDASEDIASSALFFMVRFAHVGRVRKMWTVHRIDEAKVPEEDSEGVSDVSFAQRSSKLAILQGASWKVLKVRDGRLAPLDSYDNMNPAAQPFSAIALADRRQMVITAREGNLHYFQLREDGKVPRLAEVINGAQDSVIQSISVGPEDNQIASLGANSASARIWSLGEES